MFEEMVRDAGITIMLLLAALSFVNRMYNRKQIRITPQAKIGDLVKILIITGTDNDLKLELAYLIYLMLLAYIPELARDSIGSWALGSLLVLCVIIGFHLRQWLSKWRLRNLVYFPIMIEGRLLYFKGASDVMILIINISFGCFLAYGNSLLAAAQFAGFLLHEISLEVKKGKKLLTRKLHLFDLEGAPVSGIKYKVLLRAISKYDFKKLDRLAAESGSLQEKLLLEAFRALLRDDFKAFRELAEVNEEIILEDSRLTFYFGKALYVVGDVGKAAEILRRGMDDHHSQLCLSYLVLCMLAQETEKREIEQILQILEVNSKKSGESKSDMFVYAFHALALAISTGRDPEDRDGRLAHAVILIHRAFKINDMYLQRGDLGPLGFAYHSGNDKMFLDIYGYILFRMDSLSLSYRTLQTAIAEDDTYPWPYFHLALIYERIGRKTLAEGILLRIARNERSETVLKRICIERLNRLAGIREAS